MHLPFTGGEIQGTLVGGGRISNSSTKEPTVGELVTHLRELLGWALATGSRNWYRRAWLIFAELQGRFFWDDHTDPAITIYKGGIIYLLSLGQTTRPVNDNLLFVHSQLCP